MRQAAGLLISIFLFFSLFAHAELERPLSPDKLWIQKELKKRGFPKKFIQEALNSYEEQGFETVVKLNLLGFLQPPQHMDRITPQSIQESVSFMKENLSILKKAQKKYQVPPQVISALLWIETRHGDDRGTFHVLSVYLHLLQVNRTRHIQILTEMAEDVNQRTQKVAAKDIRKILAERTKKRREWALEQLQALAEIHRQKKIDLRTLRGSFAGAFGLSQFIPSSYVQFARSANPKHPADLYKKEDAIFSVAHYLAKHGWKNRSSKAKVTALMKYNNSRDYADSILEISKRAAAEVQKSQSREISSK
ncbi:MAG: lytic murein transglycosylase [Pseudobdellovibrionaceae bacterium]